MPAQPTGADSEVEWAVDDGDVLGIRGPYHVEPMPCGRWRVVEDGISVEGTAFKDRGQARWLADLLNTAWSKGREGARSPIDAKRFRALS